MTATPYNGPDVGLANQVINSDDSSQSSAPIPQNSTFPDLVVLWTAAPPITPAPPALSAAEAAGNGAAAFSIPTSQDYAVDFGGIRDAEGAMVSALTNFTASYNNLATKFAAVKDTVFGQNTLDIQYQDEGPYQGEEQTEVSDPIQQYAQKFANGTNGQPGMNDYQAYALSQAASVIEAVGQYLVLLNTAANAYAQADASSALPGVKTT